MHPPEGTRQPLRLYLVHRGQDMLAPGLLPCRERTTSGASSATEAAPTEAAPTAPAALRHGRRTPTTMPMRPAPLSYVRPLLALAAVCALTALPSRARAQEADSLAMEARIVEAVCDRQVVVLGQLPSHGEARAFGAKARIVESLVRRCGFDALLFEAAAYDFLGLQQAVAERRADPLQLDRAIGGFWWTRELAQWRGWLFQQAVDGRLVLGGLDDQPGATAHHAREVLPALVAASLPAADASGCAETVSRNLFWRYDASHAFDEAERARLERCATAAAQGLAARDEGRGAGTPALAMAENLASYYRREAGAAGALDRGAVMYRNFRWQQARMPRSRKYIIWTATVHAARRQGQRAEKPLGTWLAEQWGDRLAVIGFSAYAGQSSMAGMPARPIPPAEPGSLEARATDGGTARAFLDRSALRRMGAVPSRLFGRVTTADWSELFDGVLVIPEEAAPVFEPRR